MVINKNPKFNPMKSETRIMQEMVLWYNNKYCLVSNPNRCLIAHVPNENQHHLISCGLLSGFSDLILIHKTPNISKGVHYYFEVKTETGTQKPKQIEFQKRIEQLGYEYYLVRTKEEFINEVTRIDNYLKSL